MFISLEYLPNNTAILNCSKQRLLIFEVTPPFCTLSEAPPSKFTDTHCHDNQSDSANICQIPQFLVEDMLR